MRTYNVVLIKTNGLTVTFSDDSLQSAAVRALRSIQDCIDREDEFKIERFFVGHSDGGVQEYTLNELKEFAGAAYRGTVYNRKGEAVKVSVPKGKG